MCSVIITVGHILTIWRKGLVISVHKEGSKPWHKCESNRHIALLCSFYNILEKIIFRRIQYWIETFSIIFQNKQQQGFTESLNCITTTYSVWSHVVCPKPYCLSEAMSVWSHIVCFRASQYYIFCLSWQYVDCWYG